MNEVQYKQILKITGNHIYLRGELSSYGLTCWELPDLLHHFASTDYWQRFDNLIDRVTIVADENQHPSFKRLSKRGPNLGAGFDVLLRLVGYKGVLLI